MLINKNQNRSIEYCQYFIADTFLVSVKVLPILLKKSISRGIANAFLAKNNRYFLPIHFPVFYWFNGLLQFAAVERQFTLGGKIFAHSLHV